MDLFNTPAGRTSMDLAKERGLIEHAQAPVATSNDATWALLVQYRGALQAAAFSVRKRVRGLTREQIEDLQSELVTAAIEAIRAFDLVKYVRLSQVLPTALKAPAAGMTTALAVPAGTLALWFKIWREAGQDHVAAATLAPARGMATDTFKAIQHALEFADSEWVTVPYNAGSPTADAETYKLAHGVLELLTPAERNVIELAYGFRGDPKPDDEVALILDSTKGTVKSQRQRALAKMRAGVPRT